MVYAAGATVPFSPLALVPPPSSRPDVGGTYAIIRVCYRPLLADRCETPPRVIRYVYTVRVVSFVSPVFILFDALS